MRAGGCAFGAGCIIGNRKATPTSIYRHPALVPSLDGLRCLSLCAVVFSHFPQTNSRLYHLAWQINQATHLNYLLLDCFFVLSGFLITRLLVAERVASGQISLGRFYARRALRILPIYYVTLVVCAGLFRFSPGEIAALATYTFNIYHPLVPVPNAMEHTWTLSVEEQFYFIWPLLLSVLPLRFGMVVTGAVFPALSLVAAVAISAWLPLSANVLAGNLIYMLPVTRMAALSLGAWLAFREHRCKPVPERMMAVMAVASLLTLLADRVGRDHGIIVSQGLYWTLASSSYAAVATALVAALVFGTGRISRGAQAGLSWRPFRAIGRVSYGAYLYHLPVLYWFGLNDAVVNGAERPIGRVALALAVIGGITVVSARYIEAPLLAVKNRIRRTDAEPREPMVPVIGELPVSQQT